MVRISRDRKRHLHADAFAEAAGSLVADYCTPDVASHVDLIGSSTPLARRRIRIGSASNGCVSVSQL